MFYVYLDTIKFIDPNNKLNTTDENPVIVENKQKKYIIKTERRFICNQVHRDFFNPEMPSLVCNFILRILFLPTKIRFLLLKFPLSNVNFFHYSFQGVPGHSALQPFNAPEECWTFRTVKNVGRSETLTFTLKKRKNCNISA